MVNPADVAQVDTAAAATQLAEHLLDPARARPAIVISVATRSARPWIDPSVVAREVGDLAEVYVMPTGEVSWAFADAMPDRTQVYGGAGRVYPVGVAWASDPYLSPLRFAYSESDGPGAVARLVGDALSMAGAAGLGRLSSATAAEVEGEVRAVLDARAVVQTDRGPASVWQELTYPAVPIDRVLRRGMRVCGLLAPDLGRLDLRTHLIPGVDRLSEYAIGQVVPVQVRTVSAESATVLLHPDVPVVVPRDLVTGNPLDSVSDLLTPGEVLAARVLDPVEDVPRVSLLDAEDDEPVPAVSLLPDGPPWLVLPNRRDSAASTTTAPIVLPAPETPAPTPRPPAPRPRPPAAPTPTTRRLVPKPRAASQPAKEALARRVRDLKLETDQLRALVADLTAEAKRATEETARQRTNYRTADQRRQSLEKEVRSLLRAQAADAEPDELFADPVDQFKHEVYLEWARRIPKSDKAARTLPDYAVGPDFLASLDTTGGIDHAKVVAVVVEVVTGLAESLTGRDLHKLRESVGGSAAPVVRSDGAVCWRAALQQGTPSARRLHYWRRDRAYELSRVVVHDDMTP